MKNLFLLSGPAYTCLFLPIKIRAQIYNQAAGLLCMKLDWISLISMGQDHDNSNPYCYLCLNFKLREIFSWSIVSQIEISYWLVRTVKSAKYRLTVDIMKKKSYRLWWLMVESKISCTFVWQTWPEVNRRQTKCRFQGEQSYFFKQFRRVFGGSMEANKSYGTLHMTMPALAQLNTILTPL